MSIELTLLRQHRNKLLLETDWTHANDSPLTDRKKTEWKTYRQALRDLPSKATPNLLSSANAPTLDLSSVTFPTKPS